MNEDQFILNTLETEDNHLGVDGLSPPPSYPLGSLGTPGTDFQS